MSEEERGEGRRLELHVTLHPDDDTWNLLTRIFNQGKKIMGVVEDMRGELVEINAATNDIASDIDALINRVPAEGGLTAEDATAIKNELSAVKDRLKGVAAQYPPVAPPDPTTQRKHGRIE